MINNIFKRERREMALHHSCLSLRPYYTMRWVCVLVRGTANAIEKEPNASCIGYITLAFACVGSRFARVGLRFARVGSRFARVG